MRFLAPALVILLAACSSETAQQTAPATGASAESESSALPAVSFPITINFATEEPTPGVAEITGMSGAEPWGRWSIEETVRVRLSQQLPKSFVLDVTARAFGPNVGVPITVRVGDETRTFTATNSDQPYRLQFDLAESADTIEFTGLTPTSPSSVGAGDDSRTLAIGIARLGITEADAKMP